MVFLFLEGTTEIEIGECRKLLILLERQRIDQNGMKVIHGYARVTAPNETSYYVSLVSL